MLVSRHKNSKTGGHDLHGEISVHTIPYKIIPSVFGSLPFIASTYFCEVGHVALVCMIYQTFTQR